MVAGSPVPKCCCAHFGWDGVLLNCNGVKLEYISLGLDMSLGLGLGVFLI